MLHKPSSEIKEGYGTAFHYISSKLPEVSAKATLALDDSRGLRARILFVVFVEAAQSGTLSVYVSTVYYDHNACNPSKSPSLVP